jgi:hypothetical protein
MTTWNRRGFLKSLGASAAAFSLGNAFPRRASAFTPGNARRVIFFYFPDGIPEPGGTPPPIASPWHLASYSTLTPCLAPLAPFKDQCIFFNGLSMGPTDKGSHPGGAKKLLTATDGGGNWSIDRRLAKTIGGGVPVPHVYLGAMATYNNAAADKFISYTAADTTAAPIDSPAQAFQLLFGSAATAPTGSGTSPDASILDADIADLNALMSNLGTVEQAKLSLHLDALRDLETRLAATAPPPTGGCGTAPGSVAQATSGGIAVDANFPVTLQAQMDVMVNAMACGVTKVGVIQASQHTSELIMSRFTSVPELYTPGYDMRSHQASHYGTVDTRTDDHSLWLAYNAQVTWFVKQLAYLLNALKNRPEGDGTMLDYSMVLICTEVADGNSHPHDNMPLVLCGGGGGRLRTGQLLQYAYRRHADLLITMANAMGDNITSFGDTSSGPITEALT